MNRKLPCIICGKKIGESVNGQTITDVVYTKKYGNYSDFCGPGPICNVCGIEKNHLVFAEDTQQYEDRYSCKHCGSCGVYWRNHNNFCVYCNIKLKEFGDYLKTCKYCGAKGKMNCEAIESSDKKTVSFLPYCNNPKCKEKALQEAYGQ